MNVASTTFEIELEPIPPSDKETLVIPVGNDGLSTINNEPRPSGNRTFYDLDWNDTLIVKGVKRTVLSVKILDQNNKRRY